MLDSFEARLTDMLADALSAFAAVQLVTRPRPDLATVADAAGSVAVVVRAESAAADRTVGDDARERRGAKGHYQLQTVLRLQGQAVIDLIIKPLSGGGPADRQTLLRVVDALLVALQAQAIRNGRAFQTGADLGFDLDGFRFARLGPPEETPGSFLTVRAFYDFSGRFWPVEAPLEGEQIVALPTRVAVLPVGIPDRILARAGGPDVRIPLQMDLRSLGGAQARIIARLQGASPPGSLAGDTANAPPGWVSFAPDAEGVVTLVYRPPATLAGTVRVGVATALSRPSQPAVPLADFVIEVSG